MRVSVQTRLLASFGVLVALMLVLGALSVARLGSERGQLEQIASVVVPSTRTVGDINALLNKYRKDQVVYILTAASDRLSGAAAGPNDLSADRSRMNGLLSAYGSHGAADARLHDTFSAHFAHYVNLTAPFATLADQGRNAQAIGAVEGGSGDAQFDGLKFDIAAWSDHEVATAAKYAASSRSDFQTGVRLILALLAGAVLTAGVVALRLARSTRRAVQEIGAAAKAISEGDIDQHVVVRSRDEFGDMAAHFDAMVGYLRSTVGVAEQIADGKLDVEVRPRSRRDVLGRSLQTMIGSLRRVTLENGRLLSISRAESTTDALTALGNRRALNADLVQVMDAGGQASEATLAIFDLDGFKAYNDTFGHPAGDALLARLGVKLRDSAGEHARAYRMGGDEFCLLTHADERSADALVARAAGALSEIGDGFTIRNSYGVVRVPAEASSGETALQLADQRLYAHKGAGRSSAQRQSRDVLMQVLHEHTPQLGDHTQGVRELAEAVMRKLGGDEGEVERVGITADLHDIGKMGIPRAVLNKPGPLTPEEWEFMRRHTIIGERILSVAPALADVAAAVRATHERWDGAGYPDQIRQTEIPLAARVVAVCDAFDAMIATRPYAASQSTADALAELRRCAGSQFDPIVVDAFDEVITDRLNPLALPSVNDTPVA